MTTLQNDHEIDHLVVDDEVFYESFDRIVSSSNSSTSNSEDETQHGGVHHCNSTFRNSSCLKLSSIMPLNGYDVWTCNESFSCSTLEQRRDRLLFALGLGSDSRFSRRKSSSCNGFDEFSSFVSCDHVCNATSNEVMTRSKSENSFESYSFSSIPSVSDTVNSNDSNNNEDGMYIVDGNGHDCHSNVVDNNNDNDNDNDDHLVGNGCVDSNENVDRVRTIKNLDTGKEFVVNEISENGTWGELREVGTGKRLTMKEFEMSFGHSPIVQELMRRQNVEDRLNNNNSNNGKGNVELNGNGNGNISNGDNGSMIKKKVSWLKNIKKVAGNVAGYSTKERRSSDNKDTSSNRGGRRSSYATNDSQEGSFNGPERVRVRQYGKSVKELSALYKSQEIKAHKGSIWAIKFSLDGMYLASAGEDRVIHVWQVVESERKGELLMEKSADVGLNLFLSTNGLAESNSVALIVESRFQKRRRSRSSTSRKSLNLEHIMVPGSVFGLLEKPFCSFQGHSDDVLDLSWSKSKLLLSSSMDKTVRLWNLSSKTCLKTFSHSDYVTCIQFNPVDDRYFISGSLDAKVRIWSIPDRQVVDWNDLHEMVTAACYTPDGQGALVGSYKGRCRLYNTSENKLQQKCLINLHNNKKKKTHLKKITGFQFSPGSSSEVLISSADSRIRLVDDVDVVHKFKGFRNTNSQISGSLTANGKYVVCASEDSQVYVWKLERDLHPTRTKHVTATNSYEHFHCQDATIAIPWPGFCETQESRDPCQSGSHPPTPVDLVGFHNPPSRGTVSSAPSSYFFDRISATWPEEELLLAANTRTPCVSWDFSNGVRQNRSAWGTVIVTAGLRGEIRTFQNFGLPVRI